LRTSALAAFIIGVTLVKTYEIERDARIDAGWTRSNLGDRQLRFDRLEQVRGPNYDATRRAFHVVARGPRRRRPASEKRIYRASRQPMTEAAIERSLTRDVYHRRWASLWAAMPGPFGVTIKPFVDWIWGGCVLMALGGLVAIGDRRYRRSRQAGHPAGAREGRRA
jgi:cytochrome c-type biogenesis protein CcmF